MSGVNRPSHALRFCVANFRAQAEHSHLRRSIGCAADSSPIPANKSTDSSTHCGYLDRVERGVPSTYPQLMHKPSAIAVDEEMPQVRRSVHDVCTAVRPMGAVMDNATQLRGRVNLALSVLSHRKHCSECHDAILTAIAALEGVPFDVLIREAS